MYTALSGLTVKRKLTVMAAFLAASLGPIALGQVELISQQRQMENSLVGTAAAPDFAPFERHLSGEDPWFGQTASVHQHSTVESERLDVRAEISAEGGNMMQGASGSSTYVVTFRAPGRGVACTLTGGWSYMVEIDYASVSTLIEIVETGSGSVHFRSRSTSVCCEYHEQDAFDRTLVLPPGDYTLRCVLTGMAGSRQGYASGSLRAVAAFETYCPADFNLDGGVDGADLASFFDAWSQAEPQGDVNADGGVDGADAEEFFRLWEAGGCG